MEGIGGLAHLEANGRSAEGKGTWVIKGNNATVQNIEFSGSSVPDHNGAGIFGPHELHATVLITQRGRALSGVALKTNHESAKTRKHEIQKPLRYILFAFLLVFSSFVFS